MLSLLLLIILFVLYSQLVGQAAYSYFPEILGKIKYKWPIGFFIILGLIQLVSSYLLVTVEPHIDLPPKEKDSFSR